MICLSDSTNDNRTICEILQDHASVYADKIAFTFNRFDTHENLTAERLSYRELWDRACNVASSLRARVERGDRVLILCQPSLDYIVAFYGCLVAGVIAVPAYPPRNVKHLPRLQTIANDADVRAVIVNQSVLKTLGEHRADFDNDRISCLNINELSIRNRVSEIEKTWGMDDLAFLQYTSGTTANAKGVCVPHRQLTRNLQSIKNSGEFYKEFRGGYWLPPYHDMGLVSAILFPVYLGGQSFLMAPETFIQRPIRWLEMLSRERAIMTAGPNFAYQLCVDAIDDAQASCLDLSELRFAWNGAENVRSETLRLFADKFAAAGFKAANLIPCYGMAESVLFSTGTPRKSGPIVRELIKGGSGRSQADRLHRSINWADCDYDELDSRSTIVSCGQPIPDHTVKIVDPESHEELFGWRYW